MVCRVAQQEAVQFLKKTDWDIDDAVDMARFVRVCCKRVGIRVLSSALLRAYARRARALAQGNGAWQHAREYARKRSM